MFLSSLMIFKILKQIEGCWLLTQLLKCRISVHFCDAQWVCQVRLLLPCASHLHIWTTWKQRGRQVTHSCFWRMSSGLYTLGPVAMVMKEVFWDTGQMALMETGCVTGVEQMCSWWWFHLYVLNLFSGVGFDKKIFKNGCSRNSGSSKCQEWSVHLTACIDKG